MASTTNVYGLLNRLDSAKVTVRQDRCVMVRNRNATPAELQLCAQAR